MKITLEEVVHVADLARLELDNMQLDHFAGQIATILAYFDALNRIDARGVKPTFHAISLPAAFRDDEQQDHLDLDEALLNAPQKEDGYFVVPRVIG